MFDPEEKKERKLRRIMRKAAWGLGIGVGLFLLKIFVTPFIGDNEMATSAMGAFSLCLFGYGALMMLVFTFARNWVTRADLLLCWVIIPAVLLKLFLDLT